MSALIIFSLLVVLMLTGMPISIALGLTVMSFFFFLSDVPMASVGLKLFEGLNSFPIMAIPFFILAGNFLTNGGAAKRMIHFASTMVGHMYGGLGLAAVLACAMFAAISGSSVATVVAVGTIMMPAMQAAGYPKKFSAGGSRRSFCGNSAATTAVSRSWRARCSTRRPGRTATSASCSSR